MMHGRTKHDALEIFSDPIEGHFDRDPFQVEVIPGPNGEFEVGSSDVSALKSLHLRRRRHLSGLSLVEVAKRLCAKSKNAFAGYVQNLSVTTIEKLVELLAVVDEYREIVIGGSRTASDPVSY